jgi:hypothetical protein
VCNLELRRVGVEDILILKGESEIKHYSSLRLTTNESSGIVRWCDYVIMGKIVYPKEGVVGLFVYHVKRRGRWSMRTQGNVDYP